MRQATTEIRDERIRAHLDRLVESGKLTQEQADEYLEWFEARPDWAGPRFGPMMMGPKGHGRIFIMPEGFWPNGLGERSLEFQLMPRPHQRPVPGSGAGNTPSTPTPSGIAL